MIQKKIELEYATKWLSIHISHYLFYCWKKLIYSIARDYLRKCNWLIPTQTSSNFVLPPVEYDSNVRWKSSLVNRELQTKGDRIRIQLAKKANIYLKHGKDEKFTFTKMTVILTECHVQLAMSIGKVTLDFRADGIATPAAPSPLYSRWKWYIVLQLVSLFDYRVNSATRGQKRFKGC